MSNRWLAEIREGLGCFADLLRDVLRLVHRQLNRAK